MPSNAAEPAAARPPSDQARTPAPVVVGRAVDVRSVALTVIAVLAVILVLQYAQAVLIPIVLGVLISYGLAPLVARSSAVHVPRAIGAALAVAVLCRHARARRLHADRRRDGDRRRASRRRRSGSGSACACSAARRGTRSRRCSRPRRRSTRPRRKPRRPVKPDAAAAAGRPAGPRSSSRPSRPATTCGTGGMNLVGFAGQFVAGPVPGVLLPGDRRPVQAEAREDRRPDAVEEESHGPDPRRDQPADRDLHPRPGPHQRSSSRSRRGSRSGGSACSSTSSGGCWPGSSTRFRTSAR